jgi:hypothetical protein
MPCTEAPLAELALAAAEEVEEVCVMSLLTRYAHERLRHSTRQRPAPERVWPVTLLAEVQVSVARRQAWVQVLVVLDERRASRDLRQGHRAVTAYPW